MGQCISRCAQCARTMSPKRWASPPGEDEVGLNPGVYEESEDKIEAHVPLVATDDLDTGEDNAVEILKDKMVPVDCKVRSVTTSSSTSPSRLVDRASQTFHVGELPITKEYFVKTYAIQQASPNLQSRGSLQQESPDLQGQSSTMQTSQNIQSDSSIEHTSQDLQSHGSIHQTSQYLSSNEQPSVVSNTPYDSLSFGDNKGSHHRLPQTDGHPLSVLEQRQEQVLQRLKQLSQTVADLKARYNINNTTSSSTRDSPISSTTSTSYGTSVSPNTQSDILTGFQDLVVSADPSCVPFSLVVLSVPLCQKYRVVLSSHVHSSCTPLATTPPVITSNGDIRRDNAQLAITVIWKKVSSSGPELMISPCQQTAIVGEANVARYLSRLLEPECDAVRATQIDELLDLAQLQLVWGNNKEKAAALRSLNASLGLKDRQGWLLAGSEPTVADVVVWSVLQQTKQMDGAPANVKKWGKFCNQHPWFKSAVSLIN